jgi:hypothetical protein
MADAKYPVLFYGLTVAVLPIYNMSQEWGIGKGKIKNIYHGFTRIFADSIFKTTK